MLIGLIKVLLIIAAARLIYSIIFTGSRTSKPGRVKEKAKKSVKDKKMDLSGMNVEEADFEEIDPPR